jgi:hypothetical protein
LIAGVERSNRRMDFVPPVSRAVVADVSAMGLLSVMAMGPG